MAGDSLPKSDFGLLHWLSRDKLFDTNYRQRIWGDLIIVLAIIAVAAIYVGHGLGTAPLMGWDEAHYAEVSRQMYVTGDCLHQRWNFTDAIDKPPLCEWATVVAYRLFGIGELGARTWSFVCGLGVLVVVFLLGRIMFDGWIGLSAALLLMINPFFLYFARRGQLDMSYVLFGLLAIAAFLRIPQRPGMAVWAGICIGLSVMSKSVFAGFPVLVLLGYAAFRRSTVGGIGRSLGVMMLAAVLVAAPWHLAQLFIHGWAFVQEYLIWNVLSRATQQIILYHVPWDQYLMGLLRDFKVSYIFAALGGAWCLWAARRRDGDGALLVCLCVVFTAALTLLVRTRTQAYLFFAYPAVALAAALGVRLFTRTSRSAAMLTAVLVMTALLFPKVQFPGSFIVPELEMRNADLVPLSLTVKEKSQPSDVLFVLLPQSYHIGSTVFYSQRKMIPAINLDEVKKYCSVASSRPRDGPSAADLNKLAQAMQQATQIRFENTNANLLLPQGEKPELHAWLEARGLFFCLLRKEWAGLLPRDQSRVVAVQGPLALVACGRLKDQVAGGVNLKP